jgi:hypothetical protein
VSPTVTSPSGGAPAVKPVPGHIRFEAAIARAPRARREELQRLLGWAQDLERKGLAELLTVTGHGRWNLHLRVPQERRSMVVVWNDGGGPT